MENDNKVIKFIFAELMSSNEYTITEKISSIKTRLNLEAKGFGGGKRKRNNEKNGEKLEEVIHVRAKRGQATDSHSLAERARREKINNRLKCLQDLVPGCYKTMGMAVMLDVIIKYVQSLQNQIEFLSMKLADACGQSDLNIGEMDGMYKFQEANAYQIQEIERMIQREEHGGLSHFQSPWTHL